jgi:hypothetical protein
VFIVNRSTVGRVWVRESTSDHAVLDQIFRKRVTALGACQVIDYHDQEWPEQVRAITGRAPQRTLSASR